MTELVPRPEIVGTESETLAVGMMGDCASPNPNEETVWTGDVGTEPDTAADRMELEGPVVEVVGN